MGTSQMRQCLLSPLRQCRSSNFGQIKSAPSQVWAALWRLVTEVLLNQALEGTM